MRAPDASLTVPPMLAVNCALLVAASAATIDAHTNKRRARATTWVITSPSKRGIRMWVVGVRLQPRKSRRGNAGLILFCLLSKCERDRSRMRLRYCCPAESWCQAGRAGETERKGVFNAFFFL